MHPPGGRLLHGRGPLLGTGTMTCNCLLVEHGTGWALVDAGFGTEDLVDPAGRLGRGFLLQSRPVLDPRETALAQVSVLGIDPRDVTDIVLTHLDVDHVGGIGDFPWARVHVAARQLALVTPAFRRTLAGRLHPPQWSHGPRWAGAELREDYRGRPAARVTERLRLVALDGHLAGHCGVVVDRPGEPDLLHAGDAFFTSRTLVGRPAPGGLAAFERYMRTDAPAWRASRGWLQAQHRDGVEILCAHERRA